MATGIRQSVGLRNVTIFALDTNGYPASSGSTAYEGVEVSGVQSLEITDPEPRAIPHTGDDRILQLDVLPPTEAMSGKLTVSKTNDVVDALVSGSAAQFTIGASVLFPQGHDRKGNESQVAVVAYRQSLEADKSNANYGSRVWDFRIYPKAWLINQDGSQDENPATNTYMLRPNLATKHLWGTTLTAGVEGVTMAQGFRGVTASGKPKVVGYTTSASQTTFSFPTSSPAVSTTSIQAWYNGSNITAQCSLTTGSFVYSSGSVLGAGAKVVAFYEVA